MKATVTCALLGLLLCQPSLRGFALAVDVDTVTPGIQSTMSVLPGATFAVDIHLVDDGTGTPLTGIGTAINFNDTPGTLFISAPTVAGPASAGVLTPVDLVSGLPVGIGAPLTPAGLPAFGTGPGGPFTGTDSGTGYYDGTTPPFGPAIPFFLPGTLGSSVILQTISFTAIGSPGAASDIAPLGILAPSPATGNAPPIGGPFGLEFYDNSAGAPGGLGTYPAAPIGPIPPGPAYPAGAPGGLFAVNPGTILFVPEPRFPLLLLTAMVLLALPRIRPTAGDRHGAG